MPEASRVPEASRAGGRGDGAARRTGPRAVTTVRPLERPPTGDLVAEHLRRQIFDGTLRPGDRITPERIAAELSVSRLPVREALLGMARDGLVVVAPHQGAYVADFDEEVVRDHFEIVGVIQGLAAVRLAHGGDADVVARLDELVGAIGAATGAAENYELVMEFHRVINVEGGSSRQRSVLRALARMLPTGFFADLPGAAESGRSGAARILAAIRSGDDDAIRAACVEVQRQRAEIVVEHLRQAGVFAVPSGGSTRSRA